MKKTIKVMAIYMASTHIPTLRCIGFSSSYLAITFLYLFLIKNRPLNHAIKLPSII